MRSIIFSIGNSKGVSIPAYYLSKLNIAVGAEVDVILDKYNDRIIIEPVFKKKRLKAVDSDFVAQVNDFIKRYRPALKKLADT